MPGGHDQGIDWHADAFNQMDSNLFLAAGSASNLETHAHVHVLELVAAGCMHLVVRMRMPTSLRSIRGLVFKIAAGVF